MLIVAQTNVQLFNQLRTVIDPQGLALISRTYDLIIELFAGVFRASGKPFVSHLVGTSSILASMRLDSDVLAAGLAHAVYEQGDFGSGATTSFKRTRVRTAISERAEELVARYSEVGFDETFIEVVLRAALSPLDRLVALIRLANELEEVHDLGICYYSDERRARTLAKHERFGVAAAARLGYPEIGAAFADAIEAVKATVIPPEIGGRHNRHSRSFRIVTTAQPVQPHSVTGRAALGGLFRAMFK